RKFIFTNGDRGHAERVARRLGILDDFEDIFDIVAAGLQPKPLAESYELFLALHSIAGASAAMFEDLARHLTIPKKLGMTTVLILPRHLEPSYSEICERDRLQVDEVDYVPDDHTAFLHPVLAGYIGLTAWKDPSRVPAPPRSRFSLAARPGC